MSAPDDRSDERDSTPLLLARLARPSVPPVAERVPPRRPAAPRPTATPRSATPPLAGVDWATPTRTTERLGKGALLLSMLLLFVAVFADLFASNLPIVCRVDGATYVFPNVTQPPALASLSRRELDARATFALRPLVFHGPRLRPGEDPARLARPLELAGHPLGTDRDGNDVFARVVHGARSYLVFALAAVAASLALGVLLGAVAGLFGGAFDALVSRVVESVSAFPPLVLVLGVQAAVPRPTLFTLFLAIALTRWPEIARLVRGEVLLASTRDYVVAARALGATPLRVLRRHILPNVRAALVVVAAMGVSGVVLTEAALDFLRVGTPAGAASWGETMSQFRDAPGAWWLLTFPGLLLVLTIIAYNLMGEALRDMLDPRR